MKINNMDFKWRVFHCYNDEGHGWVKVPYDACYRLGILRLITSYSYERGNYLYLEEDCDATTFIKALKAYGIKYELKYHHSSHSSIRTYTHYSPERTIPHLPDNYGTLEANLRDKVNLPWFS